MDPILLYFAVDHEFSGAFPRAEGIPKCDYHPERRLEAQILCLAHTRTHTRTDTRTHERLRCTMGLNGSRSKIPITGMRKTTTR